MFWKLCFSFFYMCTERWRTNTSSYGKNLIYTKLIIDISFFSIFFSKYSIKISKHSYSYKDLFTSTIVENDIFYFAIPGDCFDYCSRWLFWMSIPVDWIDDYIDQKRLYGSEVSTTYYLNDAFAVERLLCNSTTDSYFSDRFIFPWPIPISTNHWPDDWFIFERELPTAKLWPRSPLLF